jgi:hypothetical protein
MRKRFPIQLAKEAILLGDYSYAVELLRPEAEQQDMEAQFLCGYLHFADRTISFPQALFWMRRAAEQGHPEANYVLACCPELIPDYSFTYPTTEQGWQRLLYAAEKGSEGASGDLGKFYAEGVSGLPQDLEKSRKWRTAVTQLYLRHPEWVNAEVWYSLGLMMIEGIGGPVDMEGLRRLQWATWHLANPYSLKAVEILNQIAQERQYGISEDIAQYLAGEIENKFSTFQNAKQFGYREWQDYIERYTRRTLKYNLISTPFQDFVAFLFEHIPASWLKETHITPSTGGWPFAVEVESDPKELVQHYIRLFQNPEFLLERYHPIELEQAFWELRYHSWSLAAVIHSKAVSLDDAETCIREMYDLFAKLFSQEPLDTSSFMWWDSDFTRFHCPFGISQRDYDEEEVQRLRQAMFETLCNILELDSLPCEAAALHGLGHLPHPDKEKVIKTFLANHPELSDWRDYALAAIDGDIL